MKVCIVGNSHIGALKQGYTRLQEQGGEAELKFFGAPSTLLKHLRSHGGRLFARNAKLLDSLREFSDGMTEISVDEFDVVVIVGGQLHLTTALNLFRKHRPAELADASSAPVSEAGFAAALDDSFERSTASHLLKLIAPLGRRMVIVPAPMRNELEIGRGEYAFLATPESSAPVLSWLIPRCVSAWQRIAAIYDAPLLLQPADTLGPLGLTKAEFANRRSFRAGTWVDEVDTVHTNAVFGQRMIGHLREFLVASD